ALALNIATAQAPASSVIPVGDTNISLGVKNGIRFLETSGEFQARLCAPLGNSLVVRLVGKTVGIQYMYNRLKGMWKPEGRLMMVGLDNDMVLASFENPSDYDFALTSGPWMILNHYLVVHSWDPSFPASKNLPPKMVVWVHFPKISRWVTFRM
ncbi:hypothetical protein LINGRAPRIM_LOCUS124, partial [Linum grandiflorum]